MSGVRGREPERAGVEVERFHPLFSPGAALKSSVDALAPPAQNVSMLRGVFLLLLCQLCGEALSRSLSLPAPGPVIGLALLAVGLALWAPKFDIDQTDVGKAANALLGSLSLLFEPAGVGVVQSFDLLARYGVALAVALVASTVLTLLATVGVFLWVKRRAAA